MATHIQPKGIQSKCVDLQHLSLLKKERVDKHKIPYFPPYYFVLDLIRPVFFFHH